MKAFVLAFFILCLGVSSIESVNINCQLRTSNWYVLGPINLCHAENQRDFITDRENRHVKTIDGRKTANLSFKVVSIKELNCYYFPLGLETLFHNLGGIEIRYSKLKEIRREDLKNYTNLRYLGLDRNEIEFLEANLFEFTPKLEAIELMYNKIVHIDANVFNNFVNKLSYLDLCRNICKFEEARNDKSKANEIIAKVQSGSCTDKSIMQFIALETIIGNQVRLMQEVKELRVELNDELMALKNKLKTSEASLKSQVQTLSEQNSEINSQMESNKNELKSEVLEIKDQNLKIKESLSNITAQFEKCIKFPENVVGFDPEDYN